MSTTSARERPTGKNPPIDCVPETTAWSEHEPYATLSCLKTNSPEGWTMYIHPRGSIYFRNDDSRVVVDEDIRTPAMLEKANAFCSGQPYTFPSSETEVHMTYGVGASVCLFVNHQQCAAGYDLGKLSYHAMTALSPDVLLRQRRLYWNYIMNHPSHRPCQPRGVREAIDALRSYYHDHLVYGSRNIAPFSKDECEQLLENLNRFKDNEFELSLPSTGCLVGWILKDIYSYRTGQRYGQVTWTELRAYRKFFYEPTQFTQPSSFFSTFFSALVINGPCFGIPQTYLAHIKTASEFRGHLAGLRESWESYTRQLVREYSDFILISTVLLSATVGILTINDIGPIAHIAALLSAFASLGSITIGVFFVWRHQRNTHMPSSFTYLHNARNNLFGLSGHAIILSLPPVLLVWSIIAFTASALAYALQGLSNGAPVPAWLALATFVVVLIAVMAGVYTFSTIWTWQGQDSWWRSFACWPPRNRSPR